MRTPAVPAVRSEADAALDALLVRTGHQDVGAFTELYDRLAARVHGTAHRVLRDPRQAEEVVQEVFLQVWQGAARYEAPRGSARAWVMTLAHRRAVDRVRSSESSRRRDTDFVRDAPDVSGDDTATQALARLEAQSVRAALGDLTPPQRQAIELAYFGGHTYREVAALMHSPLGTTKTRIRVGLQRLAAAVATPQPA